MESDLPIAGWNRGRTEEAEDEHHIIYIYIYDMYNTYNIHLSLLSYLWDLGYRLLVTHSPVHFNPALFLQLQAAAGYTLAKCVLSPLPHYSSF